MNRKHTAILAAGLALLVTGTAAHGQDKADFAACDGRLKPKKSDDGMRGEAARQGMGAYANLFGSLPRNPQPKIIACTKALADPRLLPTQTLRRAHLLRERAAAHLASGSTDSAMADLDAAEAAVADRRGEPFFERSMGVSLALLRAIALAQQGKTADAARIAGDAATRRPYALEIQMASALIRQVDRVGKVGSPSPFEGLVRIQPEAGQAARAAEIGAGNFAAAAALGRLRPITWSDPASVARSLFVDGDGLPAGLADEIGPALDLAYAKVASGDLEGAKALLAEARAQIARLVALRESRRTAAAPAAGMMQESVSETTGVEAAPAPAALPAGPPSDDFAERLAGARLRLVEARIALAEGRAEEAATLATGKLPANAAALEYFTALRAAADKGQFKGAVPGTAALVEHLGKQRAVDLSALADTLLIAPETPRSVIDYEKSRPNILGALVGGALSLGTSLLGGIDRTAGFRSTPNADGSVNVEFTGSTTSGPMVQEMTLLRAAELARAAGKPRFAVLARKDYTRWMVASQYGREISRTPSGYKSELTIRYLEGDAEPAGSLDAVAVIDALGPLYYEKAR